MATERSTSGVSPSKSRLERNASFMTDNLNVDSSILQHRTFFSQCAPLVPESTRRRQWSRFVRQARQPTSPQIVPELQDVEYSLGVTNLCCFGGSQLRRFSRPAVLGQIELPSQNRRTTGPGRPIGQFQPGIPVLAESWRSPSG